MSIKLFIATGHHAFFTLLYVFLPGSTGVYDLTTRSTAPSYLFHFMDRLCDIAFDFDSPLFYLLDRSSS